MNLYYNYINNLLKKAMKNCKKSLILLLILGLFWLNSIIYSYENNDLELLSNDILLLEKGDIYKEIMDDFIDGNRDNKSILEELDIRIDDVMSNIDSWKYGSNPVIFDMKTVLNYLEIIVYFALIDIENLLVDSNKEENIDTEIDNQVEDTIEAVVIKSPLFPWFKTKYLEKDKNILAWRESFVYKQSFSSLYESTEIWKVIFYIEWPDLSELKNSIKNAYVYLEWSMLDTVSVSNIDILSSTKAKITFDKLDNFIITQNIRQVRLKIKTNNIGYEKLWKTIKNMYVTKVWFDDIIGLSSWRKVSSYTTIEPWEKFSIVPGVLNISLEKDLSSNIIDINIKGLYWKNTRDSDNWKPKTELKTLKLSTLWSSTWTWIYYTLANYDDLNDNIIWQITPWYVEFDLSWKSNNNTFISDSSRWEDFRITINGTNSSTYISLSLLKNGIVYDVIWNGSSQDLQILLEKNLDLWTKHY